MDQGLTVVLDVGKTLTKLSLWGRSGELMCRETRPNRRVDAGEYVALDAEGIETWAVEVLKDFAKRGRIDSIVPVAHGAAAAIIRDGQLACLPLDYEEPVPAPVRAVYDAGRDAFALSGSPRLPDGLNLGVQLAWLESMKPELFAPGSVIVTWAQYWAWLLCGEASTEATSLGCHTDLWRPCEGRPSELAHSRGWADLFAPLRGADEVLGTITNDWAERTGLPSTAKVYCGLHDSNAALLAARGFPEIGGDDATVLSTGTWFVAMRSPKERCDSETAALAEHRDCLINVDAYGMPIPSARFMGGREIQILTGIDNRRIDEKPDQSSLVEAVANVVASGARALPTFSAGVGPFPHGHGRWIDMPAEDADRRAAVCLYAALVADASLDLIGARNAILVEGRFAEAEVFVRALAALRPSNQVYVSNGEHDVSYGALRLVDRSLVTSSTLRRIAPLTVDLSAYAAVWRREAARIEEAA